MGPEDSRRIVLVKSCFDSSQKTKYGTGFRLDGRLVLTAKHVLEREDGESVEQASRIWVVPARTEATQEEDDRYLATRVWPGSKEGDDHGVDAALLETESDSDFLPFERLLNRPSGDLVSFKGIGFVPGTHRFETERRPTTIPGKFEIADFATEYVDLRYEGDSPDEALGAASWAGASGGPIFARDGRHAGNLAGIVSVSSEDFGDRLEAVASWSIANAPGFRDVLRQQCPKMPGAWRRALDLLREFELRELLRRFDEGWNSALLFDEALEDFLGDLLAQDRLGPALRHLDELAREASNAAMLEKLKDLGLALYALKVHFEVVSEEESQITETLCRLPTTGMRDTEGALAAHAGILPSFRDVGPRSRPVPQHAIPAPSLLGSIDTRVEARDTVDEVAARVGSYSAADQRVRGFLRYDLDRYPYLLDDEREDFAQDDSEAGLKRRARTIDANLSEARRLSGRQKYVTFRPTNESDTRRTDQQMSLLADWLKQLQTVRIRHDPDREVEIENDAKPLWTLLRRKPKSSSSSS